jgi:hypothetical protein
MKKWVILIFVFTFISLSENVCAQRTLQISKFRFGIQASPQLSNLRTSDLDIKTTGLGNLGLKIGAIADYYFRDNYAVSMGVGFGFNQGGRLLYEKGGNYLIGSPLTQNAWNSGTKTKSLPDGVKIRYHINHLEIPISLKMRTNQFGYLRYYAEAPIVTLGFLTKARADIDGDKIATTNENIKNDVVPLALSWGFGGGVQYDISDNTGLTAGLYYQRVFSDATKNNGYKAATLEFEGDPAITSDNLYTPVREDTRAQMGIITLRIGILF